MKGFNTIYGLGRHLDPDAANQLSFLRGGSSLNLTLIDTAISEMLEHCERQIDGRTDRRQSMGIL